MSKVKDAEQLGAESNKKFWWSYTGFRELMNYNLDGRYLNVNEKGKVQLLPSFTPRIWIFGNFSQKAEETSSSSKECPLQCPPNRCRNGGSCIDGINTFTCDCPDGWEGEFCEVSTNDCADYPCQNNGICVDGLNSFTCICQPGWGGDNCEINTDDCEPNRCKNGGNCVDGTYSFTCDCLDGWEGEFCEVNINDCADNPCQNNSQCFDQFNDVFCLCQPGYEGKYCEIDIDHREV